jgi:hypothetical protein
MAIFDKHSIYADSPLGGGHTISIDAMATGVSSLYEDALTERTSPYMVEPCQTPEQGCEWFTVIVYVFVQGLMFVLGFIGNTLSFLVLRTDRKSHAATFMLQVSERCGCCSVPAVLMSHR